MWSAFMVDEADNAKIIEVLESLSHKYDVVNVRLNQHDNLLEKINSLSDKFDQLEENVLKTQKKEHEARLNLNKDVHNFSEILDAFKKVNDNLSVEVVGFESSIKLMKEEVKNSHFIFEDLFNKVDSQIKEMKRDSVSSEYVNDIKKQQDAVNKDILSSYENHSKELKFLRRELQKVNDQIKLHKDIYAGMKVDLVDESDEREKANKECKRLISSLESSFHAKEASWKKEIKDLVEKAKKEMIVSPESYNSLQEKMNKKMELMALDASNSVLKASVCEGQLKVMQRQIEALNQKIRMLELPT